MQNYRLWTSDQDVLTPSSRVWPQPERLCALARIPLKEELAVDDISFLEQSPFERSAFQRLF